MIALQILDVSPLLNRMLKETMFDHFLLREAIVSHSFKATIDGTLNAHFYSEEEIQKMELEGLCYIPFSRARPVCLNLMRGRRKPHYFQFVFMLSPQDQKKTLMRMGSNFKNSEVSGLFLNLIYKDNTLTCTTGIGYQVFSPDKSLEAEWDRLVCAFFRHHGIAVSEA